MGRSPSPTDQACGVISLALEFHPAASDEAETAHSWYAERSAIAAARFLEELDMAVTDIQARPDSGAPYLHLTHCYLLRRFPYLIVYRQREHAIQNVAVAHGRRRPGYWTARAI